ncbi:MAG: polymer-forming cytoskeletal protein [Deltaproteobacteria bacterium]|nr:polymer-forming cytoskeletal protein [Deltaproteobacteria bacterium]
MNQLLIAPLAAAILAAFLVPSAPAAAWDQDRVTFGADAFVAEGEVVDDLITMGGNARIEGAVRGDVLTMGGDLVVSGEGTVRGDVLTMGGDLVVSGEGTVGGEGLTMGGDVEVAEGAQIVGGASALGGGVHRGAGETHAVGASQLPSTGLAASFGHGLGEFLGDAFSSLLNHLLLFVFGLFLMGLTPERFEALQVTIIRKPAPSLGYGLLGLLAAVVTLIVAAITVVGIPAAILGAIALPVVVYVGLAAFAAVFGAALPSERLRSRPMLQLGAGVLALWLVSLLPVAGGIATVVAAAVGTGALIQTRFHKTAMLPADATPHGPYRSRAA